MLGSTPLYIPFSDLLLSLYEIRDNVITHWKLHLAQRQPCEDYAASSWSKRSGALTKLYSAFGSDSPEHFIETSGC